MGSLASRTEKDGSITTTYNPNGDLHTIQYLATLNLREGDIVDDNHAIIEVSKPFLPAGEKPSPVVDNHVVNGLTCLEYDPTEHCRFCILKQCAHAPQE